MAMILLARGARFLVSTTLFVLISYPAPAASQTMTLPELLQLAFKNNGELKAFREEKGIHDAAKLRAQALPNPVLDLEGGTGALTGASLENSLGLGISQEFLLGGKRGKRLSVADRELEAYRWQLADRQRLLGLEVKLAVYDLVLAEGRLALANRSIELDRQLLAVTRERLAAGDIPELEMNLVQVELARSEAGRMDLERLLSQNRARLWELVGLPADEGVNVSASFDAGPVPTRDVTQLLQLARDGRPDLKALKAENQRSDADLVLARAEAVPNVTAGLALRRDTTSMEIGGVTGKETSYMVGVRLSIPLPLFDTNEAALQEARARLGSSESRLTSVERGVVREVGVAHAGLENAERLLSLYRSKIMPQLDENLKLTQEAYRLGEVGILAVIQEQKKFHEVGEGYLTALHARQISLAKLESAAAIEPSGGTP